MKFYMQYISLSTHTAYFSHDRPCGGINNLPSNHSYYQGKFCKNTPVDVASYIVFLLAFFFLSTHRETKREQPLRKAVRF